MTAASIALPHPHLQGQTSGYIALSVLCWGFPFLFTFMFILKPENKIFSEPHPKHILVVFFAEVWCLISNLTHSDHCPPSSLAPATSPFLLKHMMAGGGGMYCERHGDTTTSPGPVSRRPSSPILLSRERGGYANLDTPLFHLFPSDPANPVRLFVYTGPCVTREGADEAQAGRVAFGLGTVAALNGAYKHTPATLRRGTSPRGTHSPPSPATNLLGQ